MAAIKHRAGLPRPAATWKLEDAKTHFSEVVRLARIKDLDRSLLRERAPMRKPPDFSA